MRFLKYVYTHTLDILARLPRRAITIAVRVVDETPEKIFTHPRISTSLGGPETQLCFPDLLSQTSLHIVSNIGKNLKESTCCHRQL